VNIAAMSAPVIAVRRFGPGLPNGGLEAQVQLQHTSLHITGSGLSEHVPCAQCRAAVGGFDHDQLQLLWTDPITQEEQALLPASAADQAALLAQLAGLPSGTMPTLKRWLGSTGRQRWVWRTLLGSIAALCVATLLLVWQHDRVLNWLTWQIPREVEAKLADGLVAHLKREKTLIEQGKSVDTIRQIGERLTAGSAYKYQWYVLDDTSVNAFAMPGGVIVVHSGLLLKAASADELAGVLAHEVQHVEKRHSLRNMINQAGLAAGMLIVLGDVSSVILVVAHQASAQYFSRGMESEADMAGVQLLRERKFLMQPMVSMFDKLGDEHEHGDEAACAKPAASSAKSVDCKKPASEENEALGWLSSHPQISDRVKAIQAYIDANPCADCKALEVDWAAVQADLKLQLAAKMK
jgi:beta-barrel assembly-enhancing protease